MSLIVYDGKSIAAERQVTVGNVIAGYERKLVKWSKGYVGTVGLKTDGMQMMDWLETGVAWKPHKDFAALYLKNGKVYEINYRLQPFEAFIPTAIGSSTEAAEALVKVGYTAKQTVEQICKWDIVCGGKVDVVVI